MLYQSCPQNKALFDLLFASRKARRSALTFKNLGVSVIIPFSFFLRR